MLLIVQFITKPSEVGRAARAFSGVKVKHANPLMARAARPTTYTFVLKVILFAVFLNRTARHHHGNKFFINIRFARSQAPA